MKDSQIKYQKKALEKLNTAPDELTNFYKMLEDKKLSYGSIYNYVCAVMNFFNDQNLDIFDTNSYGNISANHINSYIESQREEGVSDVSLTARWTALNSFFDYLEGAHIIIKNPVRDTKRPQHVKKTEAKCAEILTREELVSCFDEIEKNHSERNRIRDKCILSLMICTGLKVDNLLQLNMRNFVKYNRCIKITNGKRTDRYYLGEVVYNIVCDWISVRKDWVGNGTEAFFVSQQGKRLSSSALSMLISKYSQQIEGTTVTPTMIRDSAVVLIYKETGDISQCLKYLKTDDVSVLQRYLPFIDNRENKTIQLFEKIVFNHVKTNSKGSINNAYVLELLTQMSKWSLNDFELEGFAIQCLHEVGIGTVEDLYFMSAEDYDRVYGLDDNVFTYIKDTFAGYGLTWPID